MSQRTVNWIKLVRNLFFLNAAIWLVISGYSVIKAATDDDHHGIALLIKVVLVVGNTGAMAFCGWTITRPPKRYYYLALVVVVVNIILTFPDQLGIYDLMTLMIDLVLLGSLFAIRTRYA